MSVEKLSITNAVQKELPLYLQNLLWLILEQEREQRVEMHHFEFKVTTDDNGKPLQMIVHTYEISSYEKDHRFSVEAPIISSIIIKLDGSGSQKMMLADEEDQ